MIQRKNDDEKKIKIVDTFCVSDDVHVKSILENNNIKVESYTRNINIEDVTNLRSLDALRLNNFYLLYVYLQDIWYIFFHYVISLKRKIEQDDFFYDVEYEKYVDSLIKCEHVKNNFLYNTRINNFDFFLKGLRRYLNQMNNHNTDEENVSLCSEKWEYSNNTEKKEYYVSQDICNYVTEKTKESYTLNYSNEQEKGNKKNSCVNNKMKNMECVKRGGSFENTNYTNDCLLYIYKEKEKIEMYNIDKDIYEKIKKENTFHKLIQINNNLSIYKLSYIYFNDKLKRIRLDNFFHLILAKKKIDFDIQKNVKNGNKINCTGHTSEQNIKYKEQIIDMNEQLFLLYVSHFKYYIFSFFLYSYVKYINPSHYNNNSNNSNNNNNNNNNVDIKEYNKTCNHEKNGYTNYKKILAMKKDKSLFLYNDDDNVKNLESVTSYILCFINHILYKINIILSQDKRDKKSTHDTINHILKNKLSFKYINVENLDLLISCILLLNICKKDTFQTYYNFNNTYSNFFSVFQKYNASLKLSKELKSKNYFSFFEGLEKLNMLEKCAIFIHIKYIRIEYIYSLLYSANNRNKFSLNINLIDECLKIYNLRRTKYFLQCLHMIIDSERIFFNMSNKVYTKKEDRCFLLDNKEECIQHFFNVYEDTIYDYIYIFYQEKNYNIKKCYNKYDIPNMIFFA
ncbi:hypothetical protein PFAG_02537 [Plasmodium falciparum Santa Lucia]|uniref:Uncharacterized protein n=2 Tax=Plasmodium falciparum TaxID=5833 RepID=W7FWC9_PLAFA|nr:hypothetical protein PFAG_02537 [Plasmodium falciparum Santa Lucia]